MTCPDHGHGPCPDCQPDQRTWADRAPAWLPPMLVLAAAAVVFAIAWWTR